MISKYLKNSTVKMAPDNYNLIGIIFTKPYIHHRLQVHMFCIHLRNKSFKKSSHPANSLIYGSGPRKPLASKDDKLTLIHGNFMHT